MRLQAAGAGRPADAQVALLTRLAAILLPSRWIGDVGLAISAGFALLIEIVASLGLFLAFHHAPRKEKAETSLKRFAETNTNTVSETARVEYTETETKRFAEIDNVRQIPARKQAGKDGRDQCALPAPIEWTDANIKNLEAALK